MAVSKKVVAQALGHGIALLAGYMVARQGGHIPVANSAEIAAIASMIVGPVAGYMAKDAPAVETAVNEAERLYTVMAESGANPRSALAAQRPTAPPVAPVPPAA